MTATAVIRPPTSEARAPTIIRPAVRWPLTANILDEDGGRLTTVRLPLPPADSVLSFGEVSDPSILLHYVFGRGKRAVLLDLDDRQLIGWLGTRWDGNHRVWWLEVDEDMPA